MTAALEPDLAAAYVHELSADVRAVVVLGPDGARLAGPEPLVTPATALAAALGHGWARTDAGLAWVARGTDRTVVAAAGPEAQPRSTALDVAAAAGATAPVEALRNPSAELRSALQALLAAS